MCYLSCSRLNHSCTGHGVAVCCLEEVRRMLGEDSTGALIMHRCIRSLDRLEQEFVHTQVLDNITALASLLKTQPKHLSWLLNSILKSYEGCRVEYRTDVEQLEYFVFTRGSDARILSTEPNPTMPLSSRSELQAYLESDELLKPILSANMNTSWLECLSQLLQMEVQDPESTPLTKRTAFRGLRSLAKLSVLPPSLFLSDITSRGRPLFGGAYADIYKGLMGDMVVCLKVLRMFLSPLKARKKAYKEFACEALVWKELNHPNILPLMGVNEGAFAPSFCLISPWMQNGNIMAYLELFPDHDRLTSICEIAEGICYLHGLDPPVTHKDIKGTNILVKDDLVCCLADFGLSSVLESQRISASMAGQGSICWMAPEIIAPSLFTGQEPGLPGDVYAFGCTVYEIYTGKPPFADCLPVNTMFEVVVNGKRPSLPPMGSWDAQEEQIWSSIDLCWRAQPLDRPRIEFVRDTLQEIRSLVRGEGLKLSWPSADDSDLLLMSEKEDEKERMVFKEWLERELGIKHSSSFTDIAPEAPSPECSFSLPNVSYCHGLTSPVTPSTLHRSSPKVLSNPPAPTTTRPLPTPPGTPSNWISPHSRCILRKSSPLRQMQDSVAFKHFTRPVPMFDECYYQSPGTFYSCRKVDVDAGMTVPVENISDLDLPTAWSVVDHLPHAENISIKQEWDSVSPEGDPMHKENSNSRSSPFPAMWRLQETETGCSARRHIRSCSAPTLAGTSDLSIKSSQAIAWWKI